MKFIEFIFRFLREFVELEPGRYKTLHDEAESWYSKMKEKVTSDPNNKFAKILQLNEMWYVQVGLIIFFLFAVKYFRAWLNRPVSSDPDDDDDDDGDESISITKEALSALQRKASASGQPQPLFKVGAN